MCPRPAVLAFSEPALISVSTPETKRPQSECFSLRGYNRLHRGRSMRLPIIVHRHPLLLDQSYQFDLSRLMASKPCDQSDVQPWSASDATSEVGTSGRGMDPGYALQSRIFRRRKHHQTEVALLWRTGLRRSWRHLKPANQH